MSCPLLPWLQVERGPLEFGTCTPMVEEEGEGEGKGAGMLSRRSACPRTFVLRVLKAGSLGQVLGEDLNRVLISFMLMYQNDIYSFNSVCPWVWLANGTNWISAIFLPKQGDLNYSNYSLVGEEKCKPFSLKCPWFKTGFIPWLQTACLTISLSFPIPLVPAY